MANRTVFASSQPGAYVPPADTKNAAGGAAYEQTPEQALAQLAATGCLNNTYYTSAEQQLTDVLKLASQCTPKYVAACAVYCRQKGFMKDMPALLLAHLTARARTEYEARLHLSTAFKAVIDNGKMLRNYVQIVRSGVTGRKSLGQHPKRLVQQWILNRPHHGLFRDSVGTSPSMADIIKMVHPSGTSTSQEALFGYLIGNMKKHDASQLPPLVREYEEFKARNRTEFTRVPDVPFQMLDSLDIGPKEWNEIAKQAGWHMTRMNLNTFKRHEVFDESKFPGTTKIVADRLRDPHEIFKARVFPYQLLTAYRNADAPPEILAALQDAMEIATQNIPIIGVNAVCAVDVSGSMRSPITGHRAGATTKTSCVQVAALVGACMLRQGARILPFDTDVYVPRTGTRLNPRDSIMTLAEGLAQFGGGGTASALPMMLLNKEFAKGIDLVVYVSDSESWINPTAYHGQGTAMLQEWEAFKLRNPTAKLVCIDLTPQKTTQAPTRRDILNIGGFSDEVFKVISAFVRGGGPDYWVDTILANYEQSSTHEVANRPMDD